MRIAYRVNHDDNLILDRAAHPTKARVVIGRIGNSGKAVVAVQLFGVVLFACETIFSCVRYVRNSHYYFMIARGYASQESYQILLLSIA
jgi:hypothetical protein